MPPIVTVFVRNLKHHECVLESLIETLNTFILIIHTQTNIQSVGGIVYFSLVKSTSVEELGFVRILNNITPSNSIFVTDSHHCIMITSCHENETDHHGTGRDIESQKLRNQLVCEPGVRAQPAPDVR